MKNYIFYMIVALAGVTLFSSCNKEEDDSATVALDSYILGTWHSYKMDAYANGQSRTVEITKNNEYSAAYIEMTFQPHNIVIVNGWMVNADGTSKWVTATDNYYIHNNVVQIYERSNQENESSGLSFNGSINGGYITRSSDNPETITMMFNNSTKNLYVRYSVYTNGMNAVGNLYFKK